MQFRDITIKELLSVLGQQYGLDLAVSADVDGVISSINLTNRTPDEALQAIIATAGNLSMNRLPSGTYVVNKLQPGVSNNSTAAIFAPPSNFAGTMGGFGQPAISSANGAGMGGSVPNASAGANALPGFGQGSYLLNDLPVLTEFNSRNTESRLRAIKVRNAPPSLIAYQLDPIHNRMPLQLQVSQDSTSGYGKQPAATPGTANDDFGAALQAFGAFNAANVAPQFNPYLRNSASSLMSPEVRANSQFGQGGGLGGQGRGGGLGGQGGGLGGGRGGAGGGGGAFDLPGDIEQIVSVDPQNVLLVAGGSDEDIRRLQELIDVLDQPLRQVEIETQFVELSTQDAQTFGIDFSTSRGNFDASTTGFASAPVTGSFQIGFVRNNFTARLNALLANNRAKVITAPRVTAINNLTATLQSQEQRALILTTVAQNLGGGQQAGQNLVFINLTTGLTVTPTINGDDTVTILLQPQITTSNGADALASRLSRSLVTVANVRDGDTIALGGLKNVSNSRQDYRVPLLSEIPLIGALFRSKTITEQQSELIIFVTARIIRRAGDNNPVPGT